MVIEEQSYEGYKKKDKMRNSLNVEPLRLCQISLAGVDLCEKRGTRSVSGTYIPFRAG
jgi:hypothetical protein